MRPLGCLLLGFGPRRGGSAPTPAAPVITSSSILGTPEDGETLTANYSRTGYPTPAMTFQWQNNGTNISGQTAQTIVLDADGMTLADGDTISCEITATNTEGSDTDEPTISFVLPAIDALATPTLIIATDPDPTENRPWFDIDANELYPDGFYFDDDLAFQFGLSEAAAIAATPEVNTFTEAMVLDPATNPPCPELVTFTQSQAEAAVVHYRVRAQPGAHRTGGDIRTDSAWSNFLTYTVSAAGYDVFLLAGQSNMIGRYGPVDPVLDATDADIMQWGYDAQTVTLASDPLDHDGESAGDVGMGITFAKAYKTAGLLGSGRKVLLVPVAKGGMAISNWADGSAGNTAVINSVNAAMAAGTGTNEFKGILWHQGESNGGTAEASYAASLDDLISRWRAAFTDGANAPVVVGGLLDTGTAGPGVRAALEDTPNRVPYTAFASAVGLVDGGDGTHFNAASQRTFGGRYFTAWEAAVANAPTVPDAIDDLVATPGDGEVTLSWTAPPSGFSAPTDYIVEYRIGAGSWNTFADGTGTTPGATVTGLTNDTAYDFRVFTVNGAGTSAASNIATATPEAAITSYEPVGVRFDGTTYLSKGSAPDGAVAGRKGTVSFWFKVNSDVASSTMRISGRGSTGTGLTINRRNGDKVIEITGRDAGASVLLLIRSTTLQTMASGWVHYMAHWDLDAGVAEIYTNGVLDTLATPKTVTAGDIAYTVPGLTVGGTETGSTKLTGALADLYINHAVALDLSNASERLKFFNGGSPVDLGTNGSVPTGTAPIIYMSGDLAGWATNKGTGGGVAVAAGALLAEGSNP